MAATTAVTTTAAAITAVAATTAAATIAAIIAAAVTNQPKTAGKVSRGNSRDFCLPGMFSTLDGNDIKCVQSKFFVKIRT